MSLNGIYVIGAGVPNKLRWDITYYVFFLYFGGALNTVVNAAVNC